MMTKKERAEFDALIKRAETLAALRWTAPVAPDMPRPETGYIHGWTFNAYSGVVDAAWSGSVSHGRLDDNGERPKYGSQGGRALFSTRLLALHALRHATEQACAEKLYAIDRAIDKEMSKDES
jgi:hypothetical protein